MEIFWAVIAVVVLLLIVFATISGKLTNRKQRKAREAVLPTVEKSIQAGMKYHVFLSHGQRFQSVKFLGLSGPEELQDGPFPLGKWLVLEKEDGKRVFVKPDSLRYYEEV